MEWLWSPGGICVLWLVLHSADYLLTVATARLKRRGNLAERVQSGGSIELNPIFQQVVDKGQWLSRRFIVTLVLGALLFPGAAAYFLWVADSLGWSVTRDLAEALCGGLVMTRFAVISIHLQNLALFRRMLRVPEAAIVSLRYDRGTVMAVSRARKLEVAGFCAIAALVSGRPFFLGGLVCVLALVAAIYRWERRQVPAAPATRPSA
jgi:hypothetical protein